MIRQGTTLIQTRDIKTIVNRFYKVLRDEHPARQELLTRHYNAVKRMARECATHYYCVLIIDHDNVKGAMTENDARAILAQYPAARIYEFARGVWNEFCFCY